MYWSRISDLAALVSIWLNISAYVPLANLRQVRAFYFLYLSMFVN